MRAAMLAGTGRARARRIASCHSGCASNGPNQAGSAVHASGSSDSTSAAAPQPSGRSARGSSAITDASGHERIEHARRLLQVEADALQVGADHGGVGAGQLAAGHQRDVEHEFERAERHAHRVGNQREGILLAQVQVGVRLAPGAVHECLHDAPTRDLRDCRRKSLTGKGARLLGCLPFRSPSPFMSLRLLAMPLLLLAPLAAAQTPLPLAQAMADPDWIGPPVEQAWWAWDGSQVNYVLKRNGSVVRDVWTVPVAGGAARRAEDAALPQLDANFPVYDRARRQAVFVRNGDVFLRDLAT